MNIKVSQIYITPGVNFPFSHLFQKWLSKELSAAIQPSEDFLRRYGEDFSLVFNLSAKAEIQELEIKGPTVFTKTKDVEYTLFLPYNTIHKGGESIASALRYLLVGIVNVLGSLGIDAGGVSRQTEAIIDHVRSDASMTKI